MSKKNDKNQNARTHGAYSREVMLPGEKIGDYEALRQAHYDEWVPDGVTEQYLVDDLVAWRWKKRRMVQYAQIILRQKSAKIRLANKSARHLKNLRELAEEFSETDGVEATEEILRWLNPLYSVTIKQWIPHDKCEDPTQWGKEIGKFLSNLEVEDPLEAPDLFAAIVNPDSMEAEILRSDRLDEAIDRKIKRLMQVKTAKQIFPNMRKNAKPELKLINAAASVDKQPAVTNEDVPKPATPTEIAVSEKSVVENDVFTPEKGVAIEGTRIDQGAPSSSPPDTTEKGHSIIVPAKVDFFAKPIPTTTVEDLQKFSAFCNHVSQQEGYSRNITPTAKQ